MGKVKIQFEIKWGINAHDNEAHLFRVHNPEAVVWEGSSPLAARIKATRLVNADPDMKTFNTMSKYPYWWEGWGDEVIDTYDPTLHRFARRSPNNTTYKCVDGGRIIDRVSFGYMNVEWRVTDAA